MHATDTTPRKDPAQAAGSGPLRGRVWKVGDWVSGDNGIVRFSELRNFEDDQDPADLARRCFVDVIPDFAARVSPGDIVVAGRGFGVPSHPPAPIALRAAGISVVVAQSTDSAFVRRSLNAGLPVVTCAGITSAVDDGDVLEVDLVAGTIRNMTQDTQFETTPFSPAMLEILRCGGLEPYLKAFIEGEARA